MELNNWRKKPFETSEEKKKLGRHCCAYACTNKPAHKKGGLCHKHYSRKLKFTDPIYDRYKNFKGNALRRGKSFQISLAEFREWCDDNASQDYKSRLWYGGKLGIDKHHAITSAELLKIFKRRFTKYE